MTTADVAHVVSLKPRENSDYWRHACLRCDSLHPQKTGTDGVCDDYRCWSCGHVWGMQR